ncbi:DUF5679 domain-containing protein [Chloroflexota bacterium]
MQAYCMKCRTKMEMSNPQQITMKNGKPATQGVCPACGTKMFRIGKSYLKTLTNIFRNNAGNLIISNIIPISPVLLLCP